MAKIVNQDGIDNTIIIGYLSLIEAEKFTIPKGYYIENSIVINYRDYSEWVLDTFLMDFDLMINILEEWKRKSPGEEILKDLKNTINDNYKEIITVIFNQEKTEKVINLLVYFGLEEELCKKFTQEILNCINIFIKVFAGKKIARFIENAMDDEFEMKPLRIKIDMRKIEEDRI